MVRPPGLTDAFARQNFTPTMPERELVAGYAKLLADLYAPESYFGRSAALVDRISAPAHPTPFLAEDVLIALRSIFRLGILGERRSVCWRLLPPCRAAFTRCAPRSLAPCAAST